MACIPSDVLCVLGTYKPYIFHRVNRRFYKEYMIHANKTATRIQEWYRSKRVEDIEDMSKMRLVQYYNAYYEWEYLKSYPVFLSEKCNLSSEIKDYAKEVVAENNKKRIIEFLRNDNITKEHILYSGW